MLLKQHQNHTFSIRDLNWYKSRSRDGRYSSGSKDRWGPSSDITSAPGSHWMFSWFSHSLTNSWINCSNCLSPWKKNTSMKMDRIIMRVTVKNNSRSARMSQRKIATMIINNNLNHCQQTPAITIFFPFINTRNSIFAIRNENCDLPSFHWHKLVLFTLATFQLRLTLYVKQSAIVAEVRVKHHRWTSVHQDQLIGSSVYWPDEWQQASRGPLLVNNGSFCSEREAAKVVHISPSNVLRYVKGLNGPD